MRLRKNLALIDVATTGIFGLSACGSSMADSREDYYELDQEYVSQIQKVMATATSPDAIE